MEEARIARMTEAHKKWNHEREAESVADQQARLREENELDNDTAYLRDEGPAAARDAKPGFTPGPWEISLSATKPGFFGNMRADIHAGSELIASFPAPNNPTASNYQQDRANVEANAALIAASPTMYDALTEILGASATTDEEERMSASERLDMYENMVATIQAAAVKALRAAKGENR